MVSRYTGYNIFHVLDLKITRPSRFGSIYSRPYFMGRHRFLNGIPMVCGVSFPNQRWHGWCFVGYLTRFWVGIKMSHLHWDIVELTFISSQFKEILDDVATHSKSYPPKFGSLHNTAKTAFRMKSRRSTCNNYLLLRCLERI